MDNIYIADSLLIASGAREKTDRIAAKKGLFPDEKITLLTEENVKLEIKYLQNISLIKNMHKEGTIPRIHGWVYSVETGEIRVLVDGCTR